MSPLCKGEGSTPCDCTTVSDGAGESKHPTSGHISQCLPGLVSLAQSLAAAPPFLTPSELSKVLTSCLLNACCPSGQAATQLPCQLPWTPALDSVPATPCLEQVSSSLQRLTSQGGQRAADFRGLAGKSFSRPVKASRIRKNNDDDDDDNDNKNSNNYKLENLCLAVP